MSDIEDMRKDLLVARVLSVDDVAGKLYLRFRNGLVGTVEILDTALYEKGRTVTVDIEDYTIELAPDEVWEEESWVGVVHLIEGEKSIVSSSGQLRIVRTKDDVPYEVGNTVEVKDEFGVVGVLSKKPLSALDAPRDDETSSSRFEFERKPGGETFEDFMLFNSALWEMDERPRFAEDSATEATTM